MPSATYKLPSHPMASPFDDARPPLKVSLYAPVYWLYDHTWLAWGGCAPLLTKMSPRAAGSHRQDISTTSAAGMAHVSRARKYDLYMVVSSRSEGTRPKRPPIHCSCRAARVSL